VGVGVIQITPQMRILVAIEPVDGRASIRSPDGARTNSRQIPSRDACLYFGAVVEPRSASWSMTAKGSGWRRNGCRRGDSCGGRAAKRLFSREPPGIMMSAEIRTGPKIEASVPRRLFPYGHNLFPFGNQFAVTADGKRFLMLDPVQKTGQSAEIMVVLNWAAELKQP